jgi:AmmeMemoRadiSam system protein B
MAIFQEEATVPRIRPDLEFIQTSYQGKPAVVVRDSLGLIPNPILIQGDGLTLLPLLDGTCSLRDIQLALVRQRGGELISLDSIGRLLLELDKAFMLESDRFRSQRTKLTDEFLKMDLRRATLAGQAYPAKRAELKMYLDALLASTEQIPSGPPGTRVLGLVAPHIDLESGKMIYAKAYSGLKGLAPKTIFLLGTGHGLEDALFSLTEKDFETPLGLIRTDKKSVVSLKRAGEKTVSASDFAHRREHSLEFQLLFLQHLFGPDILIVPILFGSFLGYLSRSSRPSQIAGVGAFLDVLSGLIASAGREGFVVAGVDFSHIGPKFGHNRSAGSLLREAKEHDRALLDACAKRSAEDLWAESRRVKDEYNVCGFSTLACLLEILPPAEGRLLGYDVWMEEATNSAVSFAAMAFDAMGDGRG